MFKNPPIIFFIILGFISCQAYNLAERIDRNYKIEKAENKREEIAHLAQSQLGSKYKYAGKSPQTGFDCSGFTYYVLKENGVSLSGSSSQQSTTGNEIKLQDARPGDLVFFKREKKGRVFHVAMILENENGNPKIIHSTSSRGVVIDELLKSKYWKPKIWKVRNVVD